MACGRRLTNRVNSWEHVLAYRLKNHTLTPKGWQKLG